MIAALALQKLEFALLGSHDPSEARPPQSVNPALGAAARTSTQPGRSPVPRPVPAGVGSAADSGPIMPGTDLG
jgi:hypothetical protein